MLFMLAWVYSTAQNNITDSTKSKKTYNYKAHPDLESLEIETEFIFDKVDIMPEFNGGQDSMMKFIMKNLVYPRFAIDNDVEGTVLLRFVVEQNGSISDVRPVGKKVYGYGLEQEAMRVVKMMPRWKPGILDGKPVRVFFLIPIKFELE